MFLVDMISEERVALPEFVTEGSSFRENVNRRSCGLSSLYASEHIVHWNSYAVAMQTIRVVLQLACVRAKTCLVADASPAFIELAQQHRNATPVGRVPGQALEEAAISPGRVMAPICGSIRCRLPRPPAHHFLRHSSLQRHADEGLHCQVSEPSHVTNSSSSSFHQSLSPLHAAGSAPKVESTLNSYTRRA